MPLLKQAKDGSEKAAFVSAKRNWEEPTYYVGRRRLFTVYACISVLCKYITYSE